MKRISRAICTLALLLMSLGAISSAHAVGLAGFSPNPFRLNGVITGGMPAWYQDINGVAVQPCLDVAACGLIGAPDFNAALPLSYPANFPSELFYFLADTEVPMGTASARVVMALEVTFVNPVSGVPTTPAATPSAVAAVFQRLRLVETIAGGAGVLPAGAAGGNFTVTSPWGITTFTLPDGKCAPKGLDTKCTFTRDILPPGIPVNPAGALGGAAIAPPDSTISTFLRDPAAPFGFLGTGAAALTFTGGVLGNSVSVSDPVGNSGTTTQITTLLGKIIGMEVQPGINHDLGAVNMITPPAVPVKKTISVTNVTGFPITFAADLNAAAVKTGADAADFLIGPPTAVPALANCAGATLAASAVGVPAGVCGFDITFTPVAAAKAARVANTLLAPTAALAVNNPPPVTLNLSGTAQVTIATTVATPHGTIAPDATVDPLTGGAPAGSPVTFTVTPSNKKFKVRSVADGVALLGTPPGTPPFNIVNTGAVNHTVTAEFMPSGDLDADGTLSVADAMKALRIVAGIQQADVDDPDNSAVMVAPLDAAGKPALIDAKANPDIGDVLLILRRVLNLDTW